MKANYGYSDGSGQYYITIDTDLCNGCKDCISACPPHIFEVAEDDYGDVKAAIKQTERNKLKYTCMPCKPTANPQTPPCVVSCKPGAILHSW